MGAAILVFNLKTQNLLNENFEVVSKIWQFLTMYLVAPTYNLSNISDLITNIEYLNFIYIQEDVKVKFSVKVINAGLRKFRIKMSLKTLNHAVNTSAKVSRIVQGMHKYIQIKNNPLSS